MLADRSERRRLLIVSDVVRAVAILGVAAATSLEVVLVLTAVIGSMSAVFDPVESAMEPDLVEREQVLQANAVRTGTRNLFRLVGPPGAGAVLGLWGLKTNRAVGAGGDEGGTLRQELREGLVYVWRSAPLRWLLVDQIVVVLLIGGQGPLLFDFTRQLLHGGTSAPTGEVNSG